MLLLIPVWLLRWMITLRLSEKIYSGDERHNVIITTSKTLGNINFCEGIADGQRIASISGTGKTVTVTSYGDEPMQYSVNADNGEQAENTENTNSVKLSDNVTAQVTVKADKDGETDRAYCLP